MTDQKQVTEFTIKRSEWARGGKNGNSALRNGAGFRCCLGFYLEACGIPSEITAIHLVPSGVVNYSTDVESKAKVPGWLVSINIGNDKYFADTEEGAYLMKVNDDTADEYVMTEAERESMIAAKFKEHGITVTFED